MDTNPCRVGVGFVSGMIQLSTPNETSNMPTLRVDVLGLGHREVPILRDEPLALHGMRGMARTVTVLMPDGSTPQAIAVGRGALAFADPRVRLAGR